MRGMNKFMNQARLSHARFANHGQDLTMTGSNLIESLTKLSKLQLASDKWRQSAPSRRLESRALRTAIGDLIDIYGVPQPLYRQRPKSLYLDVSFDEPRRVGRGEYRIRHCHLFHAGCQMRRLPDYGVVHVQIIVDRRDDDFS